MSTDMDNPIGPQNEGRPQHREEHWGRRLPGLWGLEAGSPPKIHCERDRS